MLFKLSTLSNGLMSLPFTPTYSSLSTFINCERAYQAFYVTKEAIKQDTPATLFGSLIHALAEEYARYARIAAMPCSDYDDPDRHFQYIKHIIDQYKPKSSQVYIEHELNISKEGQVLEWTDPNGLIRGRNDFICINDQGVAILIDWKTGKFKEQYYDPKQLQWNALLVFARFPEVQTLYFCYVYTGEGLQKKGKIERKDIPAISEQIAHWHHRLDHAYQTDSWTPKRSGLCKNHCEVLNCRFNGRRQLGALGGKSLEIN
jgi:hypothetical protein